MACRDLGHNAASHDFLSNFAARPVADRTLFWLFASHRDYLAGLLGRDLCWTSRTWYILKSFADRERAQRDGLQTDPAPTPGTSRVHTDREFSCYIRSSFRSCSLSINSAVFGPFCISFLFFSFPFSSSFTTGLFRPQCTSRNALPQ